MKRILFTVALICVFLLSFTSCDPAHYYHDAEEMKDTVVDISLIRYNNTAKGLFENREKVKAFDFNKMTHIESLTFDSKDSFINEFVDITIMLAWKHDDSAEGFCLMMTFDDGTFEIVSCQNIFSCIYNADGSVNYFIGTGGGNPLIQLINKYFNYEIEI